MSFGKIAWQKFVENLLSVKVWVIFGYMLLCFNLVLLGKMDGTTFAQTNAAVIGIVLAIREGIKITKIKQNAKNESGDSKKIMT